MHACLENSHPWEVLLKPFITWDVPFRQVHFKSIKQKNGCREGHVPLSLGTCDSAILGLPRSAITRLFAVFPPRTVGMRVVMLETYGKPYMKAESQHT